MTQGAVIKTCLCDCRALPLRARWVRFLAWGVLAPAVLLALGIAIVPVHELIHAVTHPMQGRSRHSVIGFWPATILFYAHYLGELRRNRFLAILLMPFVLLSVAPLALASLSQLATGSVAFVSIVNGLFACGDILGAVLILAQIPSDAVVRNQGWRSYWRREDTRPAAGAAGTAD